MTELPERIWIRPDDECADAGTYCTVNDGGAEYISAETLAADPLKFIEVPDKPEEDPND